MNDLKPPRVWHKKDKQMYPVDALYWHDQEFDSIWIVDKDSLTDDDRRCNPEDVILMMPTGLQDKNGKEIYEGDIVTMNPVDDNWNDVVIFKNGHFELRSYKSPVTDCSLQDWCYGSKNPCIVIGNIYENPDLLEETK